MPTFARRGHRAAGLVEIIVARGLVGILVTRGRSRFSWRRCGPWAPAATARDVRANGRVAPLGGSSGVPLSLTARSTLTTRSARAPTAPFSTRTLLAATTRHARVRACC